MFAWESRSRQSKGQGQCHRSSTAFVLADGVSSTERSSSLAIPPEDVRQSGGSGFMGFYVNHVIFPSAYRFLGNALGSCCQRVYIFVLWK